MKNLIIILFVSLFFFSCEAQSIEPDANAQRFSFGAYEAKNNILVITLKNIQTGKSETIEIELEESVCKEGNCFARGVEFYFSSTVMNPKGDEYKLFYFRGYESGFQPVKVTCAHVIFQGRDYEIPSPYNNWICGKGFHSKLK